MIRINLLPGARKVAGPSTGGTQGWVIGYLVAAAIMVVVLAFVYISKNRTLKERLAQNNALRTQISEFEERSANIDEVRAEVERSLQLEQVVADLQRARYGPTGVLMELSAILSAGGGPTIDPDELAAMRQRNPLAAPNPGWDPRRLWMTEFLEEDRVCTIRGVGKTNQDVAEFLRRLTVSSKFEQIELVKTEGAEDSETHLPVIEFELTCQVRY